jgi:RNA polymerase sigma-70 factor (sigma-E family)
MDERAEREFRQYVAARQAGLFRVALLLTGHREDAEDLLQASLVKLALHWTRLSTSDSVDAYVRKILYHQQVGRWRTRGRRARWAHAEAPLATTVSDPAGDSALRLSVARILGQLTKRQRAVIVLRYFEDLPESEVAEILGCSVGTVRSQTHRTLARLRAAWPELTSIREDT